MILDTADWQAISLSARVAGIATVLGLPPAFALAYLLSLTRLPCKPLWDGLIKLPLVLPPVVVGYLLLVLLGSNGPLGPVLERLNIQIVFTSKAAVLASVVVGLPLLVQALRQGMDALDLRLFDVARTLGASWWDCQVTILLPLIRRPLLAGMVMMFARSLGEFGATVILAGNIPGRTQTIPLAIYDYSNTPGQEMAALSLCLVAVFFAYAVLLGNEFLFRARRRQQ